MLRSKKSQKSEVNGYHLGVMRRMRNSSDVAICVFLMANQQKTAWRNALRCSEKHNRKIKDGAKRNEN